MTKKEIFKSQYIKIIFVVLMSFVAIYIRWGLRNIQSPDYVWFLKVWFLQIKEGGGFLALDTQISNYSPLYIYFLAFLTYLPINSLYSIKILSVIFDFIGAYYVFKLLQLKFKYSWITYIGGVITIFLPTVIINGAYAAQCDIIFTTFLIGTIYYFAKEKNILALIFFGIAVAFKLQAAFLAPLILIFLLKKQIKIWQIIISPIVYIITLLPAYFIGRPFIDLITIYFKQFGYYPYLTMNCANIYQFVTEAHFDLFNKLGIGITFIIVLGISIWIGTSKKKLNEDIMVEVSMLILIVIPFLLPQMHERYYFPAELLAIVYAFLNKKYFYISITLIFTSFLSYGPFLFGRELIDMRILAIIIFIIIIFLFLDIAEKLKEEIVIEE